MNTQPERAIALSPQEKGTIARRVKEEQFALLFAASRGSSPTAVVIAIVFWAFLYWRLGDPAVLVWAVLLHSVQLGRYLWLRKYAQEPEAAAADLPWQRVYIGFHGLTGAAWGAALWLFFPPNDVLGMAFMVLVILGVYSGGMNWMVPVKAAVLWFSVPIMVMLAVTMVSQEDNVYRVAGVLCALYQVGSWKTALQHHQLLADALYSRFENQWLTSRLEEQVALVQQASQEKSRFLAAASHDLRQPMHAMALFSSALERELVGTPQHASAGHLQDIVRALSESLDTMLDISRLEAGVVPVRIEPLALQPLLRSVNHVYASQASERGLELRVRATPLWVLTDAQLLERMLSNLVSNALKYSPKGGVLVAARRRGDEVFLEVIDTGIGIAPEEQARVFEEFYQVGNRERDRTKGLGIGLAIARRLARLLGHRIHLRSSPGRGSRFRIVMPATAPDEAGSAAASAIRHAGSDGSLPARVLVLDDEADILAAVDRVLTAYGIAVTAVRTAEDALVALRTCAEPFDAMLCDLRLSNGEDGLAFAIELPQLVLRRPPVLMITGETGPEPLQRIRDAGLPVLFKPVDGERLLNALAVLHAPEAAAALAA